MQISQNLKARILCVLHGEKYVQPKASAHEYAQPRQPEPRLSFHCPPCPKCGGNARVIRTTIKARYCKCKGECGASFALDFPAFVFANPS